jgi:hypothetical protein
MFFHKKKPIIYRVEITARRINIRAWDENIATGRDVGSVVDVSKETANQLHGSVEILGEVRDGKLIPAVVKVKRAEDFYAPRAFPARFADLGACFQAAWSGVEKIQELQFNAKKAEDECRRLTVGTGVEALDTSSGNARKLIAALDALNGFSRDDLDRAIWQCSQIAITAIDSVNALAKELADAAYTIFASRLAALELHPDHVRRLFYGSALYQRYVFIPLNVNGARNDGNGGRYLEGNLYQIADHIFRARDLRAKITPLFETAKAELAATTSPAASRRQTKLAA